MIGNGSGGGIVIPLVVLYFVPALSAVLRRHHQRGAIICLNMLLGLVPIFGPFWIAGLAWVGALVWSYTRVLPPLDSPSEPQRQPYAIEQRIYEQPYIVRLGMALALIVTVFGTAALIGTIVHVLG
jgi:hypothetical protein